MKTRIILSSFAFLISSLALSAQTPTAPLPAQIAAAKSVFLANAGSTPANNPGAIRAYNTLYQQLAAGGRYHLTSGPADADLLFEVSVISFRTGDINYAQYIQVVIRDPKTQSLLWSTAEDIESANREKTIEKNLSTAATKLAADLTNLSSGSAAIPPVAAPPTK